MNLYEVTYTHTFYETVTVEANTAAAAIEKGRNMVVDSRGDPILVDEEARIIRRDWKDWRDHKAHIIAASYREDQQ